MNRHKLVVWMLMALLWIVGIMTVAIIVFPTYMYFNKKPFETEVLLKSEASSFDWLKNHKKIEENGDSDPDVIIVSSAQFLTDEILGKVDNNILLLETLFSEMSANTLKSKELTTLTGVEYSGYMGKTYFDLSEYNTIPEKIIKEYELQTGTNWSFSGEGIIISGNGNVIVLEKGKDYKGTLKVIDNEKSEKFTGYFEITKGNSDVIAQFNLNTTEIGNKKLDEYKLKNVFPALYEVKSNFYDAYYFTGDFSAYEISLPYQYEAISSVMKYKLIYDREANDKIYWKWYYPMVSNLLDDQFSSVKEDLHVSNEFSVSDKQIYHNDNQFFIKGINLGAALPGKTFTEFPLDKDVYLNWFEEMANLNINTVRIYTLLPPVFYEALYEFNENREEPIYLLQEIWPEEHPVNSDYLAKAYNDTYHKEIEYAVHAVHGNINIPLRKYRSYGIYRYDVSKYLIGYLVGREMEPEEVKETDRLNNGYIFEGDYLYTTHESSPTESWLASSCDYTLQLEAEIYDNSPLVAIVNWPTLDETSHDSEWNEKGDKSLQYNDSAVVDIDNINIHKEKVSGFFGAYHIYPNYPDFINNEVKYSSYYDEEGQFRYGGYLEEFMSTNDKYPAVVAEYGVSTSMYTSHINPDGYNHGGISEYEQSASIIRMTNGIIREGYSGAIIFEWMDEWAKKTWTTEPYMIPYSKNQYWHNAMDPEQNYGILAVESKEPEFNRVDFINDTVVEVIETGQNEAYIFINISFNENRNMKEDFSIAISTVDNGIFEFILHYNDEPKIIVNPGYNWINGKYESYSESYDNYEELIMLINDENTSKDGIYSASKFVNLSELVIGSLEDNLSHIEVDGNYMKIRLPYGLLGIADPTSNGVLYDEKVFVPTERDLINTTISNELDIKIMMDEGEIPFKLMMDKWILPDYQTRVKNGFDEISDYFKSLD